MSRRRPRHRSRRRQRSTSRERPPASAVRRRRRESSGSTASVDASTVQRPPDRRHQQQRRRRASLRSASHSDDSITSSARGSEGGRGRLHRGIRERRERSGRRGSRGTSPSHTPHRAQRRRAEAAAAPSAALPLAASATGMAPPPVVRWVSNRRDAALPADSLQPAVLPPPSAGVDERRLLRPTSHTLSASLAEVMVSSTPVLTDLAPGCNSSSVLGVDAPVAAAAVLPCSPSALRPPTPVLLQPVPAGVSRCTSASPLSLCPARAVPVFSFPDYMAWLGLPVEQARNEPATEGEVDTNAMSDSQASRTLSHASCGGVVSTAAAAAAQTALSSPPGSVSPPRAALAGERGAAPPLPPPPAPEEIAYDRHFAVSTDMRAATSAPPLTSLTPLPLRRLVQKDAAERAGDGGPATSAQAAGEGEVACSGEQRRHDTRAEKGEGASQLLSRDGARGASEESARVFVRHFQHGKVHVKPPWYLCSALLDNCEHPYYANWLDELDLGTVEEEVARATRLSCSSSSCSKSVLGDPSLFR